MEHRDTARQFLGRGWKFPVTVDPATGRILDSSYEEDIAEAVRLILLTGRGERMMKPEFGCNIRSYMFDYLDYTTQVQLEQEVENALIRWEPRITDIQVEAQWSEDSTCIYIHISYVVRATNNPYNLVFPYYIQEGLEG